MKLSMVCLLILVLTDGMFSDVEITEQQHGSQPFLKDRPHSAGDGSKAARNGRRNRFQSKVRYNLFFQT